MDKIFANAVKFAISSMQSFTKFNDKNKFWSIRASGDIGETFLLAKFPRIYSSAFDLSVILTVYYRLALISHMTQGFMFLPFLYSLRRSNISDAGAQALAEGLQHCSNLQMLE